MKLLKLLMPYNIIVRRENGTVRHFAWTRREALEWVGCYNRATAYSATIINVWAAQFISKTTFV